MANETNHETNQNRRDPLLVLLIAYQTATDNWTPKGKGNAPIISSDVDEIQIPCQYKKEDLLQGLTAYDAEDGYITDKILIGGFSDFSERGISSLEYAVYVLHHVHVIVTASD